ncbi:MAG: hypothetical protein OXI46_05500 [Gemmatimonadota bacterium]|nr:hypothetical protein [Gemmatimonadota bacterium]
MTGLSRTRLTRLLAQYRRSERGHHCIAGALPGVRKRHALRRVILTPDARLHWVGLDPPALGDVSTAPA